MTFRSCFCGCDRFRFKVNDQAEEDDTQHYFFNICRNCNHTLAEHLKVTKQAE